MCPMRVGYPRLTEGLSYKNALLIKDCKVAFAKEIIRLYVEVRTLQEFGRVQG